MTVIVVFNLSVVSLHFRLPLGLAVVFSVYLLEDREFAYRYIVVYQEGVVVAFEPGPRSDEQELREHKLKERRKMIIDC